MKKVLWSVMALILALTTAIPGFIIGARQSTGEEAAAASAADESFPAPTGKWAITDGNLGWYLEKDGDGRTEGTVFTVSTAQDLVALAVLVNYRTKAIYYNKTTKDILSVGSAPADMTGVDCLNEVSDTTVRAMAGCTVQLGDDIDLEGKEFTPIGLWGSSFQGTFDGQTHTVSNLYETASSSNDSSRFYMGFFGNLAGDDAVAKNFSLKNVVLDFEIPATNNGLRLAPVCGMVQGKASVSDVTVEDVHMRILWKPGASTTALVCGGIFGEIQSPTASQNVTVTGMKYSSNFGGSVNPSSTNDNSDGIFGRTTGSGVAPVGCTLSVETTGRGDIGWYLKDQGASEYTLTTPEEYLGLAMLTSADKALYYDEDTGLVVSQFSEGLGWVADPLVKTGLKTVTGSRMAGKKFLLGNCLDFEGSEILPVGTCASFQGEFDGQGHSIKNAALKKQMSEVIISANNKIDNYGLFPVLAGTTVKNMTLDNLTVTVSGQQTHVFVGLLGKVPDKSTVDTSVTVEGCRFLNCSVLITGDGAKSGTFYLAYALARIGSGTTCAVTNCEAWGCDLTSSLPDGKASNSTHDGFTGAEKATASVTGCKILTEEPDTTSHVCHVNGDHVFAEEWCAGPDGHFHVCLVPECGEETDPVPHTYEWVVDKSATTTETGTKHEECTECKYKNPETLDTVIEVLGHDHVVTEHPAIPATCTKPGNEAYYTCSDPACDGVKYKEEECVNVWDDVTLPVNPDAHTENTDEALHSDGEGHFFLCTACGKEFDREEHSIGNEWKTSDEKHWKECTACGYKTEEAAHTMSWVVDQAATAEKEGTRHEECASCGKKGASEEIPKLVAGKWDGKTVDVSWYLADQKASEYVIQTPEQLAGAAALMNYRDITTYVNADGTLAVTEDGTVIYTDSKGTLYPTGATVPAGTTPIKGTSFAGQTLKLGADIDLGGKPFAPLGCGSSLQGLFDGAGHTVRNLYVTADRARHSGYRNQYYFGFFGCVAKEGVVKNLTLENVEFDVAVPEGTALCHVGGVAADTMQTSSITDVTVKGLRIRVTSKGGSNTLVLGAMIGNHNSSGTLDRITVENYDYAEDYEGQILTEPDEKIGRIQSNGSTPGALTLKKGSAQTSDALFAVGAITLLSLGGILLLGKKRKVGVRR